MQIAKDAVVAISYTLKDDDGKILDSNEGKSPMVYLHGHGNLVPGLEKALLGKGVGDEVETVIAPEEGYGVYDDKRVFEVPRAELGPEVVPQKGMVLTMRGPGGAGIPVTILKVKLRSVVMDGNHTLAGKSLHFSVKITKIRKAKRDEITHGHAHGPGGHGHAH